jgi:hypothetical protein
MTGSKQGAIFEEPNWLKGRGSRQPTGGVACNLFGRPEIVSCFVSLRFEENIGA